MDREAYFGIISAREDVKFSFPKLRSTRVATPFVVQYGECRKIADGPNVVIHAISAVQEVVRAFARCKNLLFMRSRMNALVNYREVGAPRVAPGSHSTSRDGTFKRAQLKFTIASPPNVQSLYAVCTGEHLGQDQ